MAKAIKKPLKLLKVRWIKTNQELREKSWKAKDELAKVQQEKRSSRKDSTSNKDKQAAQIKQLEKVLSNVKEKNSELRDKVWQLKDDLYHKETDLKNAKKEKKSLGSQLTDVKSCLESKNLAWEAERATLNEQNRLSKEKELRALHEQNIKEQVISNLTTQNEELASNVQIANSENEAVRSELEIAENTIIELKNASFLKETFNDISKYFTFTNLAYTFLTFRY
ncbi:uncharacterized protein LOC144667299 [Oculina patagonica]